MASATFDTLHAAKTLTQAGFAPPQAEAITDTIRAAFSDSVATKTDIAELRTEMAALRTELEGDIAELRTELKGDIAITRADIAAVQAKLEADIAAVKTDMAEQFAALHKQLWVMAVGIVGLTVTLVKLIP